MSDKIEEIRKRHENVAWRYIELPVIYEDRAFLLAEVDRMRADLATQQGCCDGAAAQDGHIRREREEHRAEVEKLRAANKQLVEGIDNISRRNREEIAELREDNYRLRADRRERIATACLAGLIACPRIEGNSPELVEAALSFADALIARLDKEAKP